MKLRGMVDGPSLDLVSVLPTPAMVFLRGLSPEPWAIVAGGVERLFGERQAAAMFKFINMAASQQMSVFVSQPMRDGMVRHLVVRAPREFRPVSMRPAPSLVSSAECAWLLWSLNDPVTVAEARRLSAALAKQCGGVPAVGEAIPLPGTIRYVATGVGLVARHQVRTLPPLHRAYRIVGGQLAEVAVDKGAADLPRFDVASDIKPEAVAWAWPNVVALGSFSIIMGEPGVGKSGIAVDIASRISAGAPWPTGGHAERGGAIILESEDDARSVTIPRAPICAG